VNWKVGWKNLPRLSSPLGCYPHGAPEQHGPHAAMLTDVIIPTEIARRVAPRLEALVAPLVSYALSCPHTVTVSGVSAIYA
jgi:creatinine amidohydrolase